MSRLAVWNAKLPNRNGPSASVLNRRLIRPLGLVVSTLGYFAKRSAVLRKVPVYCGRRQVKAGCMAANWKLVADIGGTNARFGVFDSATDSLVHSQRFSVAEYAVFTDALEHFLETLHETKQWCAQPDSVCLAVAGPVESDLLQFTNSSWSLRRSEIAARFSGAATHIINDFAAVGHGVLALAARDFHQIGGGDGVSGRPIAVLGPGTGLGVCSLVAVNDCYEVVVGEGGHADFAPVDPQEIAIYEILKARFGRVSYERLLSGAGLLHIYRALAQLANMPVLHDRPEQVHKSAAQGVETLAVNAMQMFCRVLGSFSGNLTLTLGALGGVYIAGGIAPQLISFLESSEFRYRFESKGRFRSYLADVPVRVVTRADLGLHGAARFLDKVD